MPQVVAVNKADLPDVQEKAASLVEGFASRGLALHVISSATGEGIPRLLEELWGHAQRAREAGLTPPGGGMIGEGR